MEYCSGGELFTRITACGYFNEIEAAKIFKEMLNSINFYNQQGICHKDLKPENYVFSSNEPNAPLKLIDFGLSEIFNLPSNQKTIINY